MSFTAIVGGRVLTMNDRRQIFASGTVLVQGNRIIAVGRDTEVDVPAERRSSTRVVRSSCQAWSTRIPTGPSPC